MTCCRCLYTSANATILTKEILTAVTLSVAIAECVVSLCLILQVFRAADLGLVRPFSDACSKVDGKNRPNVCQTKHLGSQYQLTQMLSAVK